MELWAVFYKWVIFCRDCRSVKLSAKNTLHYKPAYKYFIIYSSVVVGKTTKQKPGLSLFVLMSEEPYRIWKGGGGIKRLLWKKLC